MAASSLLEQILSTCVDLGVEMHVDGFGRNTRAEALTIKLAASQARELKLREALEDISFEHDWTDNLELVDRVKAALTPTPELEALRGLMFEVAEAVFREAPSGCPRCHVIEKRLTPIVDVVLSKAGGRP